MPTIAGVIILRRSQTTACGPLATSPMPTTPSSVRTSTSVRTARAKGSCAVHVRWPWSACSGWTTTSVIFIGLRPRAIGSKRSFGLDVVLAHDLLPQRELLQRSVAQLVAVERRRRQAALGHERLHLRAGHDAGHRLLQRPAD